MQERVIFHIDVNSAFLSWESVYRLTVLHEEVDLRTIPSAIGGDEKKAQGDYIGEVHSCQAVRRTYRGEHFGGQKEVPAFIFGACEL